MLKRSQIVPFLRSYANVERYGQRRVNAFYIERHLFLVERNLSTQNNQPPSNSLMQKYENVLKRWPKVYAMHRLFIDGCKWCWADLKCFYRIRRDIKNGERSLDDLSRQELEIYIQTREEIPKVVAILCTATLPLALYIFAFAIIFFPRYVLTRHFWRKEQREKFWTATLAKNQEQHYPPIVSHLKSQKVSFPVSPDRISDVHVEPLDVLPVSYLLHLFRVHNAFLMTGTRGLVRRADLLRKLDEMLLKNEGEVDQLDAEELQKQLYMRRLRFDGLNETEMREKLHQWLTHCGPLSNTSLYLHAPVLTQYPSGKKEVHSSG
jgi:hypothetical protein